MCEFCGAGRAIIDIKRNDSRNKEMYVFVASAKTGVERVGRMSALYENGEERLQCDRKINFCPICGRDLRSEENE